MKRTTPMKRTGFRTKGDAEQTPLSYRQGKAARRASTLSRNGKKTKLRESINLPNRAKFRELGLLDVCEANLPGCWPNGRKTWAHGKKDRFLSMDERKNLVIRACTVCHHKLDEEMGHEGMLAFVQNVIANRSNYVRQV